MREGADIPAYGLPSGVGLLFARIAVIFLMASGAVEPTKDPNPVRAGDHRLSIQFGGRVRTYLVHLPRNFDPARPSPVVVMLHGGGGKGEGAMKETGWDRKADAEGFIAIFPDGTPVNPARAARFSTNPQLWNDGSGRGPAVVRESDDVGFIRALLDDAISRYHADPRRLYATGFSNGASMTFRMAAELADRIAAAAPVSGHLYLKEPKPARAVPLMLVTGTADPLNPLHGGTVKIPWGFRRENKAPMQDSVTAWARAIGCRERPVSREYAPGVLRWTYAPCKDHAEVLFYTVDGLGHVWPGGLPMLPEWLVGKPSDTLNANDLIWEFFKAHPKR